LSDSAVDWLGNLGFDPQFGARPVKRVLQRELLNELSKQILAEQVVAQQQILVDVEEEKLVFRNE